MKHNAEVFAVYDISSSSVAGAHVLFENNQTHFLASHRLLTPLQEDITMERFVTETISSLSQTTTHIRNNDVHHPTFIQVTLASPWYSSQTRTISYTKKTPFVCTKKLVEDLVRSEITHILTKESGVFGAYGKESIIIEKQLASFILNGYHTTDPYKKKTTTLEFSLTVTSAPKDILTRFSEVLQRAYGARDIRYTTSCWTTHVVMRDRIKEEGSCMIVDIGEEISDVGIVKNGSFTSHHSFPVGTYGLYRALSGRSRNTARESMTHLESYRLGKLSQAASKSVETAIHSYATHWQSWFDQVLETTTGVLPHTICITADSRFEQIFTTTVAQDPLVLSGSVESPRVLFMKPSLILGVHTDQSIDVPLLVAAQFAVHPVYYL